MDWQPEVGMRVVVVTPFSEERTLIITRFAGNKLWATEKLSFRNDSEDDDEVDSSEYLFKSTARGWVGKLGKILEE
jgi:hypothetical protein